MEDAQTIAEQLNSFMIDDQFLADFMQRSDTESSDTDDDVGFDTEGSIPDVERDDEKSEDGGDGADPDDDFQVYVEKLVESILNETVEDDERRERQIIEQFDCKCYASHTENSLLPAVSCTKKIHPDLIYNTRLRMNAKTEAEKDSFIEGCLFTSMQDTEMTISTRKIPTKRKRSRMPYTIHGTTVCRKTFCFVLG